MSKDLKDLNLKALPDQLSHVVRVLSRYKVLFFLLLLAGVYGFISYRIYSLGNQQPDTNQVTSQVTVVAPHIDQSVVTQLEHLNDNSVNVRTLFEQSRQNPFSE